jgi:Tat protein translocase TatB subunit
VFNVGGGELIVILLIALVVLGPDKLPNAARQAGKYLNEFRRMSAGFQDEFRSAMDVTSRPSPTDPAGAEATEDKALPPGHDDHHKPDSPSGSAAD